MKEAVEGVKKNLGQKRDTFFQVVAPSLLPLPWIEILLIAPVVNGVLRNRCAMLRVKYYLPRLCFIIAFPGKLMLPRSGAFFTKLIPSPPTQPLLASHLLEKFSHILTGCFYVQVLSI